MSSSTSSSTATKSAVAEADGDGSAAFISMLESLVSDLEHTLHTHPQQLSDKLDTAIATTSQVIERALPEEGPDREKWMGDLNAIDKNEETSQSNSKSKSSPRDCDCPIHSNNLRDALPSPRHVRCIHSCGAVFCSAHCRRCKAREHSKHCTMLQRRKVLKSIGLAATGNIDGEMF